MSKRPNILYIFTDQQSADAMSCAGNGDLCTPGMDRLAANGARFRNAYCSYPLCTPRRASMFTGKMPHELGITGNGAPVPEERVPMGLGNVLSEAGYDCAYAGKWHVPQIAIPDREHGFRRICGFDDNSIAATCAEFMAEDRDRPFFLVAAFDNPHNICEWGREQFGDNKAPWGSLPCPRG